ncbi:MAG: phosphatidylserine decarboxylase family protein [Bacteroidetes bacterium]|nr:phosphatidylserine decarboxylase family protein [Bacteroidota bacterium]
MLVLFSLHLITINMVILILIFFRNPLRTFPLNESHILSPADGKVVVIEEVEETEYFNDKRRVISIFMSPLNVHSNRYPIGGETKYVKYHKGKYLVAWHPKSSLENERNTVVVKNENFEILFRQIAGWMARRIISYARVGEKAEQSQDMGFIRFGSRVDIYLPLSVRVRVSLGDQVRGGMTVIAK